MTQAELIKATTTEANAKLEAEQKKTVTEGQVKEVTSAFCNVTKNAVAKGEKVQIAGFGTFELKTNAAREGRNPATGEPMHIAESKSAKFKASKAFKDLVNGK